MTFVLPTDLAGLTFVPMDQADAEEVAAWRYPGIYAFYDFVADPEDHAELLDQFQRDGAYFSARLTDIGLIGFAELKPHDDGNAEIGLGLRPECVGRGLGAEFVERICIWATERQNARRLSLLVATFNERAITVYERAGFTRAEVELHPSYGRSVEFLRMTRPADATG
jgi:ribosomal-protein-alanine N-acetyltransferase